jgi:hypothetical protein
MCRTSGESFETRGPVLSSRSKFELQIKLHAARRLRGNGMTEKRGADDSNVGHVVLVVQDVKGVE